MIRQRKIRRNLPLAERHRSLRARWEQYGEWILPAEYRAGAAEEHRAVRLRAGLFDLSHLGRILIRGYRSVRFLSYFLSGDVAGMREMSARFHLICNPRGEILDGVVLYRLPDFWLLTCNAETVDEIRYWFEENLENYAAEVEPATDALAMLSLQGPAAMEIIARAAGEAAASLPVRGVSICEVAGTPCTIGRTGFTGTDGFDLFVPAGSAAAVWDALLSREVSGGAGLLPAGMRARESLRLEAGLPAYGCALNVGLSPAEAGLVRYFDFSKPFLTKDILLRQISLGSNRRFVRLRIEGKKPPRPGAVLEQAAGGRAGIVCSASYVPTAGGVIAEAVLDSGFTPASDMHYRVRTGFCRKSAARAAAGGTTCETSAELQRT